MSTTPLNRPHHGVGRTDADFTLGPLSISFHVIDSSENCLSSHRIVNTAIGIQDVVVLQLSAYEVGEGGLTNFSILEIDFLCPITEVVLVLT